ncbi:MAG: hypothetical protein ACI97B_000919 [Verrucomicrobiales bacterium]|jgi:hypothetical protein
MLKALQLIHRTDEMSCSCKGRVRSAFYRAARVTAALLAGALVLPGGGVAQDASVGERVKNLAEEAAPLKGPLYIIQVGDTLKTLADQNGWDKKFVDELKALNQLPDEALLPGRPLVIPGPERDVAMKALERARSFMKAAVAANAGTFAIDDFKVAVDVFHDGDRAREIGSYQRARLLGDLATEKFQAAKDVADARALQPKSAKLSIIGGEVFHSSNAGLSWIAVSEGIEIKEGEVVRTDLAGAAAVEFEDGARLLLEPNTRLRLTRSRVDQRTERSSRTIDLQAGSLLIDVPAAAVPDSEFVVTMGALRLGLRDALLLARLSKDGQLVNCCYRGSVDVQGADQSLLLPEGYTATFSESKGLLGPTPLVQAVDLTHPPRAGYQTAEQQVGFAWRQSAQHKHAQYELSVARDIDFGQLVDRVVTRELTYTSKPLDEGIYFARVRTADLSGVPGFSSEVITFKVTPNLEIQLGAETPKFDVDQQIFVAPKAHIQAFPVLSDSSVVGIQYRIDQGEYFASETGILLGETGSYELRARAVAADGDFGEEQVVKVTIDAQAPQLRVHVGEVADVPGYGLIRSVSFIAEDNLKLDRVEYTLDGKTYKRYDNPLKLPISRDFKISVRAYDLFGNVAETGMGLEKVRTGQAPVEKGLFHRLFK